MIRILTASFLFAGAVLVGSLAAQQQAPRSIAGWGTIVDPDGDCTITAARGKVSIKVPDSIHDLWYARKSEKKRFNAPRVLASVEGDFVAQVKVTADWRGAGPSTELNYQYIGAGLVVWDSPNQYLRLERNWMKNPKAMKASCYSTPFYDHDAQREPVKIVWADDIFQGSSTWLRVARAGQKITTSISHDGQNWMLTGDLTTRFPAKVQVGIHTISTATGEFAAEFEDFILRKQ